MTNASLFCGNLEPRMRWNSDQAHNMSVTSLCAIQHPERKKESAEVMESTTLESAEKECCWI